MQKVQVQVRWVKSRVDGWVYAGENARNAVKARFAVRDAASGQWREMIETLATPRIPGRGHTFRVLEGDASARVGLQMPWPCSFKYSLEFDG